MKQSTLTRLFGASATPPEIDKNDKKKKNVKKEPKIQQPEIIISNIPCYFILYWISSSRTFKAKWEFKVPEDHTKIAQINWHIASTKYVPVYLYCGNLPQKLHFKMENEPVYSNISYLKSHLQKCVRKGRADLAVLTAKHLMKLDMVQFIRRIFIISLEDVDVFSNIIPVLAWLTAVGTNPIITQPSMEMVEYLLGMIHSLCKFPSRWKYSAEPPYTPYRPWSLRLKPPQRDLLWSMCLRHSYGGMHWDLRLIENAIDFRSTENGELYIRPIIWDSVYYYRTMYGIRMQLIFMLPRVLLLIYKNT